MAINFPTSPTVGQTLQSGTNVWTWNGTVWTSTYQSGSYVRQSFTATASQTTFTVSGGYQAGLVDVYQNGVKLVNGSDVTVTSGTSVVLATGAAVGDIIEVIGLSSVAGLNYLPTTGGTLTGDLDVLANVGIGTTSPLSLFHVNHTGSNSTPVIIGDASTLTSNTGIYLRTTGTANIQWGTGGVLTFNSGSERMRIDASGYVYDTNVVSTQNTAATLTAAQVLSGILVTSPAGAITLTMPTGTALDAAFPNNNNQCRDFTIVNTTANVVTLAANTGITLTGGMQPTASNPCLFRLIRTGAATYTVYRAA